MPIVKKNSNYYVVYWYGGRRFQEQVGKNKRIAQVVMNKVKAEIAESRKK